MAISRAAAYNPVTSFPAIETCPLVTGSYPANARNDVDFPHPEGPTNTRNSPSSMARSNRSTLGRVAPGYVMVTESNTTVAIVTKITVKPGFVR